MKINYKIGQLAEIFAISTDTLRYYEKEGLLLPERDANSYRIYSIFDIWKLNLIQTMKSLGISLKEIKYFLENRTVANEKALLIKELSYIDEQISSLTYQKSQLINRLEILDEAMATKDFGEILVKKFPRRKIIYTEYKFTNDPQVDLAYTTLIQNSKKKINFLNRDFGMVLPMEKIKARKFNEYSKAFLIIDKNDKDYDDIIPQGLYAVTRFKGAYSKIGKSYKNLQAFLRNHSYKTPSYAIERYLVDINQTYDPNEYITEIQIKLEERKN